MAELKVIEVAKLTGVSDLPTKARLHFSRALILESQGNLAKADEELNEAIKAEQGLERSIDGSGPDMAA